MAGKSRAVPRRGMEEGARPDALAYWHEQERAALDPGDGSPRAREFHAEGAHMPGGWWILPAVLLSVAAWAALTALLV